MIESTSSRIDIRLEEIINIGKDVDMFSNNKLKIFSPKRLYSHRFLSTNTGLFRHHRGITLHCPDNQEVRLSLIIEEAAKELKKNDKHYFVHIGLVLLGARGLTRRGTRGKFLLCLYDNRHKTPNKATIGIIEVDMNNNIGIFYLPQTLYYL